MEGSLEAKDSATGTEEPIKSEAPVQSPGGSNRSDGAASPPPNCSICLGNLVNTSFTDSCLHQFCFTCLLQWSKIKTECPLCKQTFKSIIHNVRSEEDYDQYHVPREMASQMSQPQVMATLDLNFDIDVHRFFYRTTMTANRRHGVVLNPEQVARREQLPIVPSQVSWEERRRRRANPTDYRRTVYRLGIWASPMPDMFGRFRECSAEYYRREPRELNRLIPWLNRELQVLLNNNSAHVAYVMTVILDALSEYDIRSSEFRDLVRRYFGARTEHFVYELLNYARTNFDLVGYDQSVTYMPQGLSNEFVPNIVSPTSSSSSTSSDDSDVRVLDEAIDLRVNTEIPSVGPHPINMPGPSTVGQAFHVGLPFMAPDVFTISSNSCTSEDECEVIGYVKPRHERTPEIIELLSSDPEDKNDSRVSNDNVPPVMSTFYGETAQPSTSHTVKKGSTSSSVDSSSPESESDSDSDYTCRRRRWYQNRGRKSSKRNTTTKRRNRSVDTKSRNRANRNLSSSGESASRKRVSKRNTQRTTKKRLPSTSDSNSQETKSKKSEEKRSKRGQYYTRGTVRVRKDLIKVEDVYTEDSSSSDSSSDTDDKDTKTSRSRALLKSKRAYHASSSSDFDTGRSERVTRTRGKTRQTLDSEFDKKEQRYKESKQSRSRSSSTSSYTSQKEKKSSCRRRESQRDVNEYASHDDSTSVTKDSSRKEHESRSKSKGKRSVLSSSDSEDDRYRSNSQCSKDSSKSYVHWKKSKYKDRHKSKERKRSNSRTYNSSLAGSNTTNSNASISSKAETYSTSKHSDSKNNSSSKERRKFHKSRKESKHKRSQNDTKSKSKKKRRRIRSSTNSNSE